MGDHQQPDDDGDVSAGLCRGRGRCHSPGLDPRNAVSYPEKRPFFLEGLEQFSTPNNLIYTRKIEAPLTASSSRGKSVQRLAYVGRAGPRGFFADSGRARDLQRLAGLRDIGSTSIIGHHDHG